MGVQRVGACSKYDAHKWVLQLKSSISAEFPGGQHATVSGLARDFVNPKDANFDEP